MIKIRVSTSVCGISVRNNVTFLRVTLSSPLKFHWAKQIFTLIELLRYAHAKASYRGSESILFYRSGRTLHPC